MFLIQIYEIHIYLNILCKNVNFVKKNALQYIAAFHFIG